MADLPRREQFPQHLSKSVCSVMRQTKQGHPMEVWLSLIPVHWDRLLLIVRFPGTRPTIIAESQ